MPDHNATRFFTLRCNYDNGALGWEHWALPALDSAINARNTAGHAGYALRSGGGRSRPVPHETT